jgi:hypothetical protein
MKKKKREGVRGDENDEQRRVRYFSTTRAEWREVGGFSRSLKDGNKRR